MNLTKLALIITILGIVISISASNIILSLISISNNLTLVGAIFFCIFGIFALISCYIIYHLIKIINNNAKTSAIVIIILNIIAVISQTTILVYIISGSIKYMSNGNYNYILQIFGLMPTFTQYLFINGIVDLMYLATFLLHLTSSIIVCVDNCTSRNLDNNQNLNNNQVNVSVPINDETLNNSLNNDISSSNNGIYYSKDTTDVDHNPNNLV